MKLNELSPKQIWENQKELVKQIANAIAKKYGSFHDAVWFLPERGIYMYCDAPLRFEIAYPLIEVKVLKSDGINMHQGEEMVKYVLTENYESLMKSLETISSFQDNTKPKDCPLELTGIKFVVQHNNSDRSITTWQQDVDDTIENMIRKLRHNHNWMGGKFLEIFLIFNNNGKYYKTLLDIDNSTFNNLIAN
jgi:hypothetical protein